MAQTVGTRAGDAHRGDFLVTCAYCGAVWYRSKCRRNAAGQLICPDDQHIRDPVTLARMNAARSSRLRSRRVDGGSADHEALTTAGPLSVCPELVVAGWDAASGVTLAAGGRVSAWAAVSGGLSLDQATAGSQPKLLTNGPSGRSYVSFGGSHSLQESTTTFKRPAPLTEPTFYWAIVRNPRWAQIGTWWCFTGTSLISLAVSGGTNQLNTAIRNGTFSQGTAHLNEFLRIEAAFTASVADYLKLGSETVASGGSAGNTAPTGGFGVGKHISLFFGSHIDVCELWILRNVPTAAQKAQLDDYARAKYGTSALLTTPVSAQPPTVTPPTVPPPNTIMAGNIVAGWDAASLSASPVALWPDASGNGFDLVQAVGANQPSWGATTGPNSQPAVLFDGINDTLANSLLNLPAPGTTPTFFWAVLRQVTWAGARRLWTAGAGSGNLSIAQASGSPNLLQENATLANTNGGLTLNTYKRLEVRFSNTTSDYIKAGSTNTTGANAGNVNPAAGFQLASAPNLGNFTNIEVCELWIFNALPTPTQRGALDDYVNHRYGAGLT